MLSPQSLDDSDRRVVAAWAAIDAEVRWQLAAMSTTVRDALRRLPRVGEDSAGPLGAGGLLATGVLGSVIRTIQSSLDTMVDPG